MPEHEKTRPPSGKRSAPTEDAPQESATSASDSLRRRLSRVASLLGVGVDIRSALATELIRTLRTGGGDRETLGRLFNRLGRADPTAPEIGAAHDAAEAGDSATAIRELQSYLQRTTVDEVPISERRLRRRDRPRD